VQNLYNIHGVTNAHNYWCIFCKAAADFVDKNLRMQILLYIHTVEPLYYGHFGTKYFWPLFAAI